MATRRKNPKVLNVDIIKLRDIVVSNVDYAIDQRNIAGARRNVRDTVRENGGDRHTQNQAVQAYNAGIKAARVRKR
jgi:hypothetical protein